MVDVDNCLADSRALPGGPAPSPATEANSSAALATAPTLASATASTTDATPTATPEPTPTATAVGADVPWVARVQASQKGRDKSRIGRKITRTMMQTIERWKLVEPGDRIMVAVSGGKDSYTLLDLLWEAKQRAPFHFDVVAVHLDQVQPGYDGTPLVGWLAQSKIPYEIVREDTYSIVVQGTKPGQAYCFLCSRLRRGILYSQAERLRCNKIALGHHRDDALETMLMNLCYAGKLQAMPARYTTDDQRFVVVRPLIDCAEKDIAAWAAERAYPILPCNLCGSQDGLKRDAMNDLLTTLEKSIPDVRAVMHHALSNVRPTHLLDKDVADVWATRPADVRPQEVADPGPRRMTGDVVASFAPPATLVRRGALTIVAEGSGGLGSDEA